MGERGPKPKRKVNIRWSPNFAYAIGLIATDGNLSKDGRHISFTSKDREQINNFLFGLKTDVLVSKNISGNKKGVCYRVQFSDIIFYKFLNSIGLFSNKSKTIGEINIPPKYFFDFLRGCFDGDGTIYSYWDNRWKNSFMFYISFATASLDFMNWLRFEIKKLLFISGHVKKDGRGSTYQLTYAKKDSEIILKKMYRSVGGLCLSRKKLKTMSILAIVGKRL